MTSCVELCRYQHLHEDLYSGEQFSLKNELLAEALDKNTEKQCKGKIYRPHKDFQPVLKSKLASAIIDYLMERHQYLKFLINQ